MSRSIRITGQVSSRLGKRLWWLATCVVFVACASAPAPTPTKKKKKKKKKRRDEIALKQDKDADRNEDEEKPDRPAKKKKDKEDQEDEVAVSDDDVTVVDDDGDAPAKKKSKKDTQAEKKRKKAEEAEAAAEKKREQEEAAAEAAAEKKRKKEEAAEAAAEQKRQKEEAAAEKKRKKSEETEVAEDEPPTDEEEPKPKKGKKTEKVAAKSKKAKKKEEEEIEVAAEEPPPEEEEPKPVKNKKIKPEKVAAKSKSKPETAEVDMTSTDEPTIDMEDSGGSSLDTRVDDEPPAGRVAAIPVPGVDDDSEEQSVTAEATPIGANPLAINERPLTLPDGKLAVHGGLRVGVLTLETMPGVKTSSTSTGFGLGVNYGVSSSTEVGLDYTVGISPGTVKGPLTLHGAYLAVSGAKLDVAVAAATAIDFSDFTDPMTMQTTTRTAFSVQIGAWARYRINRKASLFSGLPALPNSTVSLSKLSLALPPMPYQLTIGLNSGGTTALDVPIGLGYQINPKIYAFGMLNLAHIRIANTVNAFLFKDFIPISIGGFYALDKLDIGAEFSDDLKQGTDYLRFDTFVRYSIK